MADENIHDSLNDERNLWWSIVHDPYTLLWMVLSDLAIGWKTAFGIVLSQVHKTVHADHCHLPIWEITGKCNIWTGSYDILKTKIILGVSVK